MTFSLSAPPNRSRFHRSQVVGDDGEDQVEAVAITDAFRAFAHLCRRYAKTTRDGRTIRPQGPDFSGWIQAPLVPCYVEIKYTRQGRLDFARFSDAQRGELQALHDAGGLSVVLVLQGPRLATASWCPVLWNDVLRVEAAGWASMPETDVYARAVPERGVFLEFAHARWQSMKAVK